MLWRNASSCSVDAMNRRRFLTTAGAAAVAAAVPASLASAAASPPLRQPPAGKARFRTGLVAYSYREALKKKTMTYEDLIRIAVETGTDEQELGLRSSLSVALNSSRGYAAIEVEQNLDRVFTLSAADGRGQVPVRWLWVAFTLRFMLGDLKATRAISEQALERSAVDPSCRCEAHHAMGAMLLSHGELEASRDHLEASLAAYDEAHPQCSALGSDLGVFAHAWYSHTLWLLGEENAAVAHAEQAITLAQRLDHKYSQTLALAYGALLHQMRLDPARVLACAEAAVELCARHGFGYYGEWARVLIGWARGQERPEEGIPIIESALESLDRSRAQARRPYYLSLLADTYGRLGKRDRAASIVDSAIGMALDRGDVWWVPALYLQRSDFEAAPEREAMLQRALAVARAQHSRGLEQRILASSTAKSI
jgi:tetratricopeptide (TPR) repeat protein